jgi:hypothetical protein
MGGLALIVGGRSKFHANDAQSVPNNPARVTRLSMTRQPKVEIVGQLIVVVDRQLRSAVGYVDQSAIS